MLNIYKIAIFGMFSERGVFLPRSIERYYKLGRPDTAPLTRL